MHVESLDSIDYIDTDDVGEETVGDDHWAGSDRRQCTLKGLAVYLVYDLCKL